MYYDAVYLCKLKRFAFSGFMNNTDWGRQMNTKLVSIDYRLLQYVHEAVNLKASCDAENFAFEHATLVPLEYVSLLAFE